MTTSEAFRLAQKHLEKVQVAWLEPTDWSDLAIYGFLALENAVVAGAQHFGITVEKTHPSKNRAADTMRDSHGLPDITPLMLQLWDMRQSESYGDVRPPQDLDAEFVASEIDAYVEAIRAYIEGSE